MFFNGLAMPPGAFPNSIAAFAANVNRNSSEAAVCPRRKPQQ
jgi:hypothetical protein